jgi:recombination protein U
MTLRQLLVFWERMESGGRKSFRFEELEESYFFEFGKGGIFVPYLQPLQRDLDQRGGDST